VKPLLVAQLCQLAYQPAVTDADLAPFGLALVDRIIGHDLNGPAPYGFVAQDDGGTKYACFPGTRNAPEWIEDFICFMVGFPYVAGALVEAGFLGVYLTLKLTSGGRPESILGPQDVFLGHSLGGSLATQCAAEVGSRNLYTVACPRAGNDRLAVCFDSTAGLRIVNPNDLVPMLPARIEPLFPFCHVGSPVLETAPFGQSDPIKAHQIDGYITALS
jgi:hypothetical protein